MDCQKTFLIFCLGIIVVGCGGINQPHIREGARAKAKTRPMAGYADECAIWADKDDPKNSVVIGNDKSPLGALYVYNLSGDLISKSKHMNRPVGVSVRYGIKIGQEQVDVVGCAVRSTNEIKLFKIDPKTKKLFDMTSKIGITSGFQDKTYGFCLYKRSYDGKLFAFVSRKKTDHIHQIEFYEDEEGKFAGRIVRKFGKSDQKGFVEGMVADDEYGYYYCSDERHAILKYYADPNIKKGPFIRAFGMKDGIQGDREGLGLYIKPKGKGYLIVSSQGNSTFKIYAREGSNAFIKTAALRKVTQTDGIGISSLSMPPDYPYGIFVAHSNLGNNYLFFDWKEFSRLN